MIGTTAARVLACALAFAASAVLAAVPPAPTTIAPNGTVNAVTPTFTWDSLSVDYDLLVQNTSGVAIFEGFYGSAAGCGMVSGVCSYTSAVPLTPGATYSWFVRGKNNEGAGPWSAPRSITIDPAATVSAPIPVSPDGVVGVPTASFGWKRVVGNLSYELLVQNTSGVAFDRTYSAEEVNCVVAHSECYTLVTGLAAGTYNWFVRVTTAAGTSAWSDARLAIVPTDTTNSFPTSCLTPETGGWVNAPAGSAAGWIADYAYATEGFCSLRSAQLAGPGAARIQLTGTFNAGMVSFDRKVSSEREHDCLRFLIDGAQQNLMGTCSAAGGLGASGEDSMKRVSVPITAGAHTLVWSYEVDGTGAAGLDAAWIDNLSMPIVVSIPALPSTIAPSGTSITDRPTFQWSAAPGAVSYDVTVFQQPSGARVVNMSFTAAEVGCAAGSGTCSKVLPLTFAAGGSYTWSVRSATSTALSPWSAPRAFSISQTPTLETPTPLAPIGPVSTMNPLPSWTPVTDAYSYEVELTAGTGTPVSSIYVVGYIYCSATCSGYFPATVVPGVTYTWRVRARDGGSRIGAYSAPATFIVSDGPQAFNPSGTVTTLTPDFTWATLGNTTGWDIELSGTGRPPGSTLSFSLTCSATCTLARPFTLVDGGTYSWRVRGYTSTGITSYGSPATFTVVVPNTPPPTPTTISPEGVLATSLPTYQWNATPKTDFYRLAVTQGSTPFIGITYTPLEAGCSSGTGTCSVTPRVSLEPGVAYQWSVNASNPYGSSSFSATRSVTALGLPAPVTVAPTGDVVNARPTFSWNPVQGASSYSLLVQNTSGVAFSATFTAADAGCGSGTGTCSFIPSSALPAGSFNWFASASGGGYTSAWSIARAIRVVPPPVEFPLSCVLPSGPEWKNPPAGATAGWSVATDSASQGACSLKSNPIADGGAARIEFAGWFNAGTLSFDRRVSSEYNFDCLRFHVDGAEQNIGGTCLARGGLSVGGEVPWGNVSFSIPAGFHTLRWSYEKNGSLASGSDAAWIDNLVMPLQAPVTTAPAAPVGRSPDGIVITSTPAFSWTAVPGAASYRLQVQNTSSVAYSLVFSAAEAGCDHAALCNVTPSTSLMPALYNWFVNASNAYGTSPWSDARTVHYDPAPVNAFPSMCSPSMEGWVTAGINNYGWGAATDFATEGVCSLRTFGIPDQLGGARAWATFTGNFNAGYITFDRKVSSEPGNDCLRFTIDGVQQPLGGSCATGLGVSGEAAFASVMLPITAGAHTLVWSYEKDAIGSAGMNAAWIDNVVMPLVLPAPSLPGAPVLVSPSGTVTTINPTYTWNAVAGATSYYLLAQNTAGVAVSVSVTPASAGCGAGTGTCSVTPGVSLANGSVYNWFVNASNSVGTGPWSAASTITVSGAGPSIPGAPTPIAPVGTIATTTPTYSWNAIAGATSYYLLAQNTSGVAVSMSVSPAAAGCGSGTGTCSIVPPGALGNGAVYNWFVNATNSLGTGPWSAATTITVSATGPSAPPAPLLISPWAGMLATNTPNYHWMASSGATSYYLLVQNTAGVRVGVSVSASAVCSAGECSYTPATALASGTTYNWFVNATNSYGTSPWSEGRTVTAP